MLECRVYIFLSKLKKLSFCRKGKLLFFFYPYIFATWCRRTMNSVKSNSKGLLTSSCFNNMEIRLFEFVARTQFILLKTKMFTLSCKNRSIKCICLGLQKSIVSWWNKIKGQGVSTLLSWNCLKNVWLTFRVDYICFYGKIVFCNWNISFSINWTFFGIFYISS